MKKYSDEELQEIFKDLDKGKTYCGVGFKSNPESPSKGCGGLIYKGFDDYRKDIPYICWSDYGSSANQFSIEGLKFVIGTIFQDYDFVTEAKYDANTCGYLPIIDTEIAQKYQIKNFYRA